MGGGTTSTTVQQPSNPTLPDEAREGYVAGRGWTQKQLENPSVYGGKRVADVSPLQASYLSQLSAGLGKGKSELQQGGERQAIDTLGGRYLGGPEMQAAIGSAAEPLFQSFTRDVLPGLRGQALQVGAGGENSRMQIAQGNAQDAFAGQLARGVVAPIWEGERARQMTALGQVPQLTATEMARLGVVQGGGSFERGLEQEALDAERAKFEEPIYRQAQAAGSLTNAPFAGGGGTSSTNSSETPGIMGAMSSIGSLAMMAKALSK
jgi:hypothetical protein